LLGLADLMRTIHVAKNEMEVRLDRRAADRCCDYTRSGLGLCVLYVKRIEHMNNCRRIAVVFAAWHDAEFAIAGVEDNDAHEKRGGEVPATGMGEVEGLRHRSVSCL